MSNLNRNYDAYVELQQQIQALQQKADQLLQEGRATALEEIRNLIRVYAIRADELGFPVPPAPPRRDRSKEKKRDRSPKGAPKYHDPESGLTWTGAGKPPNWIIGKNYDDFLIRPAVEQQPAPPGDPAQNATVAVQGMVSAHLPAPAAAWPEHLVPAR